MSAVGAAVAVAASHGVRCEKPIVLREAWHVLVHLRPLPVVARVSSGIPFPVGPRPDDVVRELHVAGHAAQAGAPVIPPADELNAGPHRHGGHVVTFWRYVSPPTSISSSGRISPFVPGTRSSAWASTAASGQRSRTLSSSATWSW